MELKNLNKSMSAELFRGELEVTEMPEGGKSGARLYQASLRRISEDECKMIQRITQIMEEMEKFCQTKKNMFLPIREGIAAAKEIKKLSNSNEKHGSFLISLEYFLGLQVAKDKEKEEVARRVKKLASLVHEVSQTDLEPEGRSTPDSRKRPREPTESPEDPGNKKPEEKRPKASKHAEEWVEVSAKKGRRKKRKNKPEEKKPAQSEPPRSEAILIKPSEGVSYAAILKNLKSRVNPDELGAKIRAIRETRTKDLLVELECKAEDRVKLDSAFRDAI